MSRVIWDDTRLNVVYILSNLERNQLWPKSYKTKFRSSTYIISSSNHSTINSNRSTIHSSNSHSSSRKALHNKNKITTLGHYSVNVRSSFTNILYVLYIQKLKKQTSCICVFKLTVLITEHSSMPIFKQELIPCKQYCYCLFFRNFPIPKEHCFFTYLNLCISETIVSVRLFCLLNNVFCIVTKA